MKNIKFTRFSQLALVVVCVLLLTAGCKSEESWDSGLLSKENKDRPRTSAEILVLFTNMSARFDSLMENLEGTASEQKMAQLLSRLSGSIKNNLSNGELAALWSNQQQIETLSETAKSRAAALSDRLENLNADGVTLSANQITLLDRLLEEYAKDIEDLLSRAETSKKNQMDKLDIETLKGFSAKNIITMQELEIEALSTLNDYLKEVNRVLLLQSN